MVDVVSSTSGALRGMPARAFVLTNRDVQVERQKGEKGMMRARHTFARVCFAWVLVLLALAGAMLRAFVQSNPPNWGLWRIDQPDLAQARADNRRRYVADGKGINIYVIDDGVDSTHPDFCCDEDGKSRVTWVGAFCWGATTRTVDPQTGNPYPEAVRKGQKGYEIDGDGFDGHGTHNASFAAGKSSGTATAAHIYALRVQGAELGDCNTEQAIINAVNWIVANKGTSRAVVNLSLRATSARAHQAMDESIVGSIAHPLVGFGLTYTLTGNTGGAVEQIWGSVIPAEALVVGGIDDQDRPITDMATNPYGPLLALFAPAKGLCGASLGEAFNFSSPCAAGSRYSVPEIAVCPEPGKPPPCKPAPGDSFAAPLVAGVAAIYLQQHPSATPVEVRQGIINRTAKGKVTNVGTPPDNSPNQLLQMVRDDVSGDLPSTDPHSR
jgi:hypothetical protein